MQDLIGILAALVAFAATFAAGHWYGVKCRKYPAWRYWAANVAGVLAGGTVAAAGNLLAARWLFLVGLAVIAGSVTGLKYGLGRVVGPGSAKDPNAIRIDDDEDEE